jgi:hypothetical protein
MEIIMIFVVRIAETPRRKTMDLFSLDSPGSSSKRAGRNPSRDIRVIISGGGRRWGKYFTWTRSERKET